MWTMRFLKDASERMFFTALTAVLGSVAATDAVGKTNWHVVWVTAAVATGGTLVKCLAASLKGDPASASMVE